MAHFAIRAAVLSDLPVLVRHRRLMWWDMGRRNESALDLMEKSATEYFSKALPEGGYRGFLAIDDGGNVIGGGGVVISAWPGVLGQPKPSRAMILNLYVERDQRRRGVASALMRAMIAWCRENRFASVGLHASDAGRPLYEKLGFKPTNEMRLELDAPAEMG